MKSPKALVVSAPGINCDLELSQAFSAAGARPETILLSRLIRNPTLVDQFALIGYSNHLSMQWVSNRGAGRVVAWSMC